MLYRNNKFSSENSIYTPPITIMSICCNSMRSFCCIFAISETVFEWIYCINLPKILHTEIRIPRISIHIRYRLNWKSLACLKPIMFRLCSKRRICFYRLGLELLLPSDVVIRYLHWPRIEVCYHVSHLFLHYCRS